MTKFFRLIPHTNIDFIARRKTFFLLSAVIMLACVGTLVFKGINYGLDFTGGTMVQVQFEGPADISLVRKSVEGEGLRADIQTFVGRNAYSIKVKGSQDNVNEVAAKIESALKATGVPFNIDQRDFVGPTVGSHLAKQALLAFVLSMAAMVIYIGFRFSNIIWGAMTVAAMFHDVFLAVGVFSFLQLEVDLVMVAAFLTVAGFTINSTIVVFDRVRENIRLNPKMDLAAVLNMSINETLARTVITTLTVVSATAILFFMGGSVLRNFSLAMLIGIICGVYTTACLAPGLVYQWSKDAPVNPNEAPKPQASFEQPKKKNKKRYN